MSALCVYHDEGFAELTTGHEDLANSCLVLTEIDEILAPC